MHEGQTNESPWQQLRWGPFLLSGASKSLAKSAQPEIFLEKLLPSVEYFFYLQKVHVSLHPDYLMVLRHVFTLYLCCPGTPTRFLLPLADHVDSLPLIRKIHDDVQRCLAEIHLHKAGHELSSEQGQFGSGLGSHSFKWELRKRGWLVDVEEHPPRSFLQRDEFIFNTTCLNGHPIESLFWKLGWIAHAQGWLLLKGHFPKPWALVWSTSLEQGTCMLAHHGSSFWHVSISFWTGLSVTLDCRYTQ